MANQVRLNHELLIWVGFTLSNGVWSYPDGVTVDNGVPYFPESLDACIEWLVPKLSGRWEIGSSNLSPFYAMVTNPNSVYPIDCGDKTPALALCLAIQKLIRSK